MTKSLKPFIPFEIKYYEVCNSLEEAVQKEKYWKTAAGRRYLKKKIN
jgi:putative endonuclease